MSTVRWTADGIAGAAAWHSESAAPVPRRVVVADETMPADTAYRLARAGTGLLWRGGYPGARLLLRALARRVDRDLARGLGRDQNVRGEHALGRDQGALPGKHAPDCRVDRDRHTGPALPPAAPGGDLVDAFFRQRRAQAARARLLGRVLVLLEAGGVPALRRAPDVRQACREAYGPGCDRQVVALRELLGVIGAHEWRTRGVPVPALGARVHPHYGVFAPVRGEYVDLVARAPLPARPPRTAFDVGTGTGVLAAVAARRGAAHVVATDADPRALACATANAAYLGLADRITVTGPALFPAGRADLVVCNPPWLPVAAATPFERAVHDTDGAMLHAFLTGLPGHLEREGEAWLILSDLPERLGLRARDAVPAAITEAGLRVRGRLTTRPRHRRAGDPSDPLHAARAAEVTSLWRLVRG